MIGLGFTEINFDAEFRQPVKLEVPVTTYVVFITGETFIELPVAPLFQV